VLATRLAAEGSRGQHNGDEISPHGAVQERYKFPGFLRVPITSLQGIAVRPLPCNYNVFELAFTAVTRVQIPSGTPNPFRNLRAIVKIFVGTKRHNSDRFRRAVLSNRHCFRVFRACFHRHKKAHVPPLHVSRPPAALDGRNSLMTSL